MIVNVKGVFAILNEGCESYGMMSHILISNFLLRN